MPANETDYITIAWNAYPRSFDPRYAVDADSQHLENLLHCSLVDFNADWHVMGYLAEHWTWKNASTLEIKIKKGIKFSDNSLVTGYDVKATLDFFLNQKLKNPTTRSKEYKHPVNNQSIKMES